MNVREENKGIGIDQVKTEMCAAIKKLIISRMISSMEAGERMNIDSNGMG